MNPPPESLLEAVRKRPSMYVGNPGSSQGPRDLACELLSNALDQVLAGAADRIECTCEPFRFSIRDNGDGISIEPTQVDIDGVSTTLPFLTSVFTGRHDTPTRDGHHPNVYLGIGGIGPAVVCALASELVVTVGRGDGIWGQRFRRGVPVAALERVETVGWRGTRVDVHLDRSILTHGFDVEEMRGLLFDIACLARIEVVFNGERFHCPNGLADEVRNRCRQAGLEPAQLFHVKEDAVISVRPTGDEFTVGVEAAVAFFDASPPVNRMRAFASFYEREQWYGSHVQALERAVTSAFGVRSFCSSLHNQTVCAVHAIMRAPGFGPPTRAEPQSPEAGVAVRSVVETALRAWLVARPELVRAHGRNA